MRAGYSDEEGDAVMAIPVSDRELQEGNAHLFSAFVPLPLLKWKEQNKVLQLTKTEKGQALRARRKAEGRCSNCGKVKATDETNYSKCRACLATSRAWLTKKRTERREKNPPAYARDARKPFRYGKTRLKNPRLVDCVLDFDVLNLFDACRKNWVTSPDYEPYQVSEFVRRILALLQRNDQTITCYGNLHRSDSAGFTLSFQCDEGNYAVLTRQRERTGCSLSAAIRDCLRHGCKLLLAMPDREAQRYLWPRNDEPEPTSPSTPTEPEQKCKPVTVVRIDKYRKYDFGDLHRESEFR